MIELPFHLIPFLLAQRPPKTGRYVVPLSRLDAQTRAEMDAAIKAHQETAEKHAALLAGEPTMRKGGRRWVVERTTAWTNAHKKLVWCTERRVVVVAFWIAFSAAIIIVGRLVREGWRRYRWDGRPARKP